MLMLIDKLICYCSTKIIPEGLGVKNDLISYNITNKKLNLIDLIFFVKKGLLIITKKVKHEK